MTREEAIAFLEGNVTISKKGYRRFNEKKIKSSVNYQKLLKFINKIPNYQTLKAYEILFCLKNNFNTIPKCKICNQEFPFKIERTKTPHYIKKYCSLKCFNADPEIRKKSSEREKLKANERLKKRKETVIKKYGSWEKRPGAENFKNANERLKIDENFRKKRTFKTRETNLKKYGVPHQNQMPNEAKRRRLKADRTLFQKYGVSNPMYLQEIKVSSISRHIPKKRYLKINKEFLENHFIDKNNYALIDDLVSFLNCTKTTAYRIFERHSVEYTKQLGGFNPDKPAILYYIYDPQADLYKIGITNNTIEERFGKTFCSNRAIALKEQKVFDKGIDAYLEEQEILKQFAYARCINEDWPAEKGGRTEFFKYNILQK